MTEKTAHLNFNYLVEPSVSDGREFDSHKTARLPRHYPNCRRQASWTFFVVAQQECMKPFGNQTSYHGQRFVSGCHRGLGFCCCSRCRRMFLCHPRTLRIPGNALHERFAQIMCRAIRQQPGNKSGCGPACQPLVNCPATARRVPWLGLLSGRRPGSFMSEVWRSKTTGQALHEPPRLTSSLPRPAPLGPIPPWPDLHHK